MSIFVKHKMQEEPKKVTLSSWDDVIADVGRQIDEAEERVKGLKRVERNFKSLRDSGEPFHAAAHN